MDTTRDHIHIRVRLDEKTFTDFAVFNAFKLHKRLKQPLLFAGVMLIFALVCFFSGRPQGGMTGAVLILVGLALPGYYVLRFMGSTRASIKSSGLPREAYDLTLGKDDVVIQSLAEGGNSVTLKWSELHHAYRSKGCIYLYAMPLRAFLLPDGQADDATADELWQWIVAHIAADKASDMR